MDGYITTNEIAQRLGVKVETVRRWVRQGKLPGLPLGRAGYRIRQEDFERFLQNQQPEQLLSTSVATANPSSDGASNDGAYTQMEAVATLILERMTDGVLLFGLNEQCLYANDAATHLLGSEHNELLGKTVNQILPDNVYDSEKTTIQGSNDYFSAATNRWYQIRTFAALQGRCVSFLDVTERKQQQLNAAFLADLTEVFSSLSSQEEILRVTGKRMAQYFIVPSLAVAMVNEAADEFTVIYDSNEPNPESVFRIQRFSNYANEDFLREMRAGRVIVVNDTESDPRTTVSPDDSLPLPVRAFLLASHLSEGQVDFVLGVQRSDAYDWRRDEIELLQELITRLYPQLERVRAEQALRASRTEAERQWRFFEKIFDNLSNSVFIWDRQHRYVYINRILEKLWGIPHGAAVGKTTADLGIVIYPSETSKITTEQVEHVFETGEDVLGEIPYMSPDGVNGYFEYIFSPVLAADGTVEFVAGISQDISKRKRMEEALRESEERFRRLVETYAQSVWETNATGEVVKDSPSWRAYTGQTFEKWIGYGWVNAVHPNDHEYAERQWREAIAAKRDVNAEFRLQYAKGGYRWTNVRATPLFSDDGSVAKWVGMNIDIHNRKLAEEALRQSEEKYRTLFESMDEGFFISDVLFDERDQPIDIFYLEANPSGIRMTGQDYTGKRLREIDPNYEPYWYEIMGRVALTGQSERQEQYAEPHKAWYDFYAFKIGDAESRRVAVIFQDITERKQIEEDLKKARERFSIAEEAAHGFIYDWDLATESVFRSRGVTKLLGYESDELAQTSTQWFALIHVDDLPRIERERGLNLRGDRDYFTTEYRVRHKDGAYVHVLDQGLAMRDERGAITRIVGSTTDMTERKQMEQALRDSEQRVEAERQRLYDVFMQAPISIAVTRGPEHVYELANPLTLQLLGTHRPILGKPIREALPEMEGQGFFELLDAVYQTGQPFVGNEVPAQVDRKSDGTLELVYLNFVYQPFYNAIGKIDGIIAFAYDVTETVLARKRIEESEDRLRSLANSMPQLVWSARADGAIDFFNARLSEYAEMPRNEEGIYEWQAIAHPDDREGTKRDWEHANRAGKAFESEHRMQMKDGTYRWHLVRGLPVYDANGSLLRWYGTKTDIEQLKQLERQRTDFLGVVSHELKTPVTSARAFAEVLENRFRKAGDERTATLLDKIRAQMDKLTNLIGDLLDVTKIEAGKLQFHEDFFAFDALVDDILEEVQRTTTHTLERIGTTSATVYGDRERVGQVITNLLTNAVKYSPNTSHVVVTTFSNEQEVTLCVQDFGIGIAREKLPHVFERFYRETGAREDTFAGLGLGLYVASEIISRQGGRIWVESEKDQGSTFCFALPLQGSKNTRRSEDMFVEE